MTSVTSPSPRRLSVLFRRNADKAVAALPPRIVAAIRERDDASEVLIKLIQLAIVGTFGFLYAISPKTDAGTTFSLVPYVLGAYLVLNLIGLLWTMRARLPDWSVYVSILFDIGLLMALMVSFHIQYQQPASFSLKAPTLLYVFIFIALRTLRFQPRFVLAAGITAALGWLGMVIYVITVDPHDAMITRNYVTYLTSNSILLGAEFDKIITILTVTFILTLVLRRGRDLLVQAVAESAAAQSLSRFFDESVATQIRAADREIAAGEGVSRRAAILNVDMRGFTTMSATMRPSDVMTLLADYQSRMVPIVQRNGGTIDKFLGDGIMATFGAVAETPTCAADALRAADEIMDAAEVWAREREAEGQAAIDVNASVASGNIVFGAVGHGGRLEYTVIGAAVNLSAKLEKYNKVLHVRAVVLGDTYDEALRQGYVPRAECRRITAEVEGTSGMHDIVVLRP